MNKIKNELKELSFEQLVNKLDDFRRELFSLKLQNINNPIKDKTQFKKLRKIIACTLTYMQQKKSEISKK